MAHLRADDAAIFQSPLHDALNDGGASVGHSAEPYAGHINVVLGRALITGSDRSPRLVIAFWRAIANGTIVAWSRPMRPPQR